jgi:pantetheine-phosphate adenylyltransferase
VATPTPPGGLRPSSKALFAGSFDPITNGHVDLVTRGRAIFGDVLVAVGNNPAKRYLLPLADRVELVRAALAEAGAEVEVVAFEGLVVEAARRHGATVMLRGLRGPGDLELELRNAAGNRDLAGIDTVFLPALPQHLHVSSTLVREIAGHGGDVSRYVPRAVLERLRRQ